MPVLNLPYQFWTYSLQREYQQNSHQKTLFPKTSQDQSGLQQPRSEERMIWAPTTVTLAIQRSQIRAAQSSLLIDVWQFTESDTKITEELFATWPEPPEDTCLWVDCYILRYIRDFTSAWMVWMYPLTVLKRLTSWGYCGLKWNLLEVDLAGLKKPHCFGGILAGVNEICCGREGQPERQKLIQIWK